MSGNMSSIHKHANGSNDEEQLEGFMKKKFGDLYRRDGKKFQRLMSQLEENGIYEIDGLKDIDKSILDSLELPHAHRNRMQSLISEIKGENRTILGDTKNLVGLVISEDGSSSKASVSVKDQAKVILGAGDDPGSHKKGKNVAVAGVGNVEVTIADQAKFEGTAGDINKKAKREES